MKWISVGQWEIDSDHVVTKYFVMDIRQDFPGLSLHYLMELMLSLYVTFQLERQRRCGKVFSPQEKQASAARGRCHPGVFWGRSAPWCWRPLTFFECFESMLGFHRWDGRAWRYLRSSLNASFGFRPVTPPQQPSSMVVGLPVAGSLAPWLVVVHGVALSLSLSLGTSYRHRCYITVEIRQSAFKNFSYSKPVLCPRYLISCNVHDEKTRLLSANDLRACNATSSACSLWTVAPPSLSFRTLE